jgi:hypothetical protein
VTSEKHSQLYSLANSLLDISVLQRSDKVWFSDNF